MKWFWLFSIIVAVGTVSDERQVMFTKVCTICKRNEEEVSFTWRKPYCDECHDIPGVSLYGRPVQDLTLSVGDDIELSESN